MSCPYGKGCGEEEHEESARHATQGVALDAAQDAKSQR
jgi:hypothetical protein